ncbi:MAG: S9 family peptidase [Pseudomonadota bacterium]
MRVVFLCLLAAMTGIAIADDSHFANTDVFNLELAVDPQIAPDGSQVVYVRQSMDIMSDRAVANLWIVDSDGDNHRPLLSGRASYGSPRWSPDGDRLAYVSGDDNGKSQIHLRWMDTGQTAVLSNVQRSPQSISWSPDGKHIAFIMFVKDQNTPLAAPPAKPAGAKWAPGAKVIETLPYRSDGRGYLETGYNHVFLLPADGGTPRQLTRGDYNHSGPLVWSPDSEQLVFSANRIDEAEFDPIESELWALDVASGEMAQLTDRDGPDRAPAMSADGKSIAYLGFDDMSMSWEQNDVYVLDRETGATRKLTGDFDRSISAVRWAGSSSRLLVQYEDRGRTHIGSLGMNGRIESLTADVGGLSIGRPYNSGMFSVADNGSFAYTEGAADRPADVTVGKRNRELVRLTDLNSDLFDHKTLGRVEAISWPSASGDYEIPGWLVTPPDFDPEKKYPLILEIHGGPHTAYGPHFSAEVQLFAAAGYVVLYANPRGSTSYGREFALEIHHNYPSEDYDDLMAGIDAVLELGYVDEDALYVTGGSGGGVLTAWIVGKTDRFRAAVVAKPVVNWASFALTADAAHFFTRYWFPAMPWDDPMGYWDRSPLSLVGNVTTPTALLTGEEDFRTPMPESEQYYQALKLRKVDTALIRIPEASHGIARRPSQLIAKVDNILAWFARYPAPE